jgi:hypothetical protein
MIMSEPEVRVFDSVSAAIENSLPPVPPPYAFEPTDGSVPAEQTEPVPDTPKAPAKRAQRKPGAATAQAGAAGVNAKAQDPA